MKKLSLMFCLVAILFTSCISVNCGCEKKEDNKKVITKAEIKKSCSSGNKIKSLKYK